MANQKKYQKGQVIQVTWIDAVQCFEWQDEIDDSEDHMEYVSVGHFLAETPRSIIIVQTLAINPEKNSNHETTLQIPKVVVQNIDILAGERTIHSNLLGSSASSPVY